MGRPRRCRRIQEEPRVSYFKPRGIPLMGLTEVYLTVEGFEAIRLADWEGKTMEEAATHMNISRHTFGRILGEARKTVADALVNGRALCIQGGDYEIGPEKKKPTARETPKEMDMNKIAVTSEGPNLQDKVDPRFGRAGGFLIVDPDTMEAEYVDNGSSQAMPHGAGLQSAERIANAGAGVLLTGYVGPKAFQALQAAGIKVGQDLDGGTVQEAVEKYKAGQVDFASEPNR